MNEHMDEVEQERQNQDLLARAKAEAAKANEALLNTVPPVDVPPLVKRAKRQDRMPRPETVSTLKLPWRSLAEIRKECEQEVPWVWDGYLARQAVTLVSAEPKAGKSTFVFGLMQKQIEGTPFLGRTVAKGPAIYLSEESLPSLREKADRFGLTEEAGVQFLSRRMTVAKMADVVMEAAEFARKQNSPLIVLDTLGAWAGFNGDDENSAGTCEATMNHLKQAAGLANAAVLVVHHTRKDSEVVRGSSAITAAVDISLILTKDVDNKSRRSLKSVSRFVDTPESLTFDLNDCCYEVVITPSGGEQRYEKLLAVLPFQPSGMTREQICLATGHSEWSVRQALKDLQQDGLILRKGSGRNKDPHWYSRMENSVMCDPLGGHRVSTPA